MKSLTRDIYQKYHHCQQKGRTVANYMDDFHKHGAKNNPRF